MEPTRNIESISVSKVGEEEKNYKEEVRKENQELDGFNITSFDKTHIFEKSSLEENKEEIIGTKEINNFGQKNDIKTEPEVKTEKVNNFSSNDFSIDHQKVEVKPEIKTENNFLNQESNNPQEYPEDLYETKIQESNFDKEKESQEKKEFDSQKSIYEQFLESKNQREGGAKIEKDPAENQSQVVTNKDEENLTQTRNNSRHMSDGAMEFIASKTGTFENEKTNQYQQEDVENKMDKYIGLKEKQKKQFEAIFSGEDFMPKKKEEENNENEKKDENDKGNVDSKINFSI
jgi:hypothetical protein